MRTGLWIAGTVVRGRERKGGLRSTEDCRIRDGRLSCTFFSSVFASARICRSRFANVRQRAIIVAALVGTAFPWLSPARNRLCQFGMKASGLGGETCRQPCFALRRG